MEIHKSEKKNGVADWRTADGRFRGVLIEPQKLYTRDKGTKTIELPAGALLAVPKYHPGEAVSINKYSPLVVQASSIEGLAPLLAAWADQNYDKTPWELRIQ